ncbi:MAG: hypothetical protein Kow0040_05510 [Thermogutta sp.]
MSTELPADPVDRQMQELWGRQEELEDRGFFRSSIRVAHELRRLAKTERRVVPYIRATLTITHCALCTFETELGMELATEMVALLESEEHARQFQPEFPDDEYQGVVFWLSTCAYHHLGSHAAIRYGHGSPRVRDVVREGNEVCRRTGKIACLDCFRDYTVWVYLTLGDEQTALHFARSIENKLPILDQGDHRFEGARMHAFIHLLCGRLSEAVDQSRRALELAKVYHTPLLAKLDAFTLLGSALHLSGRGDELPELCAEVGEPLDWSLFPPEDENPDFAWRKALFEAVVAACADRPAEAAEILDAWDRRLTQWEAVPQWLETRTRLISVLRMMGKDAQADGLEKDLRRHVNPGEAALYFSRLDAITSGKVPPSAIGFLHPPTAERIPLPPLTGRSADSSDESEPQKAAEKSAVPSVDWDKTPMGPMFNAWFERLPEGTDADSQQMEAILDEMLSVDPAEVELPEDGARLIFVAGQLAAVLRRENDVWQWARRLLERFPEHPDVLNLSATAGLGAWMRHAQMVAEWRESRDQAAEGDAAADAPGDETPTEKAPEGPPDPNLPDQQTLEHLMRKSLDLKPDHPRHCYRAGVLFHVLGLQGDAEWCFARSFALDRTQAAAALALAEVYADSKRDEDALFVLDLCLREGKVEDADVAWEAGLAAFRLERYAEAATYFNLAGQWRSAQPWLPYYFAWSLLETKRPDEAETQIDVFSELHGPDHFAARALRAWLAAIRGETETVRDIVRAILDVPLREVDDLTPLGIEKILRQLWRVVKDHLPAEDPLQGELIERLFQAGMVPDDYFEEERARRPITEGLKYYECAVEQPLDDAWPKHPACMAHQINWREYYASWGVLARNEEEAEHYVIQAQQRCYVLPPTLMSCDETDTGFRDRPGVVWQGARECPDEYDEETQERLKRIAEEMASDDEDSDVDGDFLPDDDDDEDDDLIR